MAQKPEEHAADMVSREEYEQLQADLNASQSKVSELEQQVNALTEALRLAQHKRFGASSEKTVDDGSQQLSFLFNEAAVISDHEAAQDKLETLVAAHKRRKKHEYTLDNLPEGVAAEVIEHRIPQEELECPICEETMQEIGKEVVRKIIPAQVVVVEHRYYAYACRRCDTEGIETPVTSADREKSVIRGSFATAEAIAHSPHHGAEVCHGLPAVSAGAGTQTSGYSSEPTDHVQLDIARCSGLPDAGLRRAPQGASSP